MLVRSGTASRIIIIETRQWAASLHRKTKRPKESHQRFGFTRDLRVPDNLALRVHNAHAREFQ
jgi:hypothetical protein